MSDLRWAANRAIERAIEEDRSKRWVIASEHYSEGIDLFNALVRIEPDISQRRLIAENVERYQQRLDRLRRFIEDELSTEPSRVGTPISSWDHGGRRSSSPHTRLWTANPTRKLSVDTGAVPQRQRRYSFGNDRSPIDRGPNFSRSPPTFPPGSYGRPTNLLGIHEDNPFSAPYEPFPFSPDREYSVKDFGRSPPPNERGRASTRHMDKDTESLRKQMENTVLSEKPNVHWDDIAGLEEAKQALKEAVVLPLQLPHLFKGKRAPWRGILLYGPPGTGKSYLAKAVATEAEATFFSVSSSDLVSKWMGESEKLIKNLFQMAREQKPAVIFIDELDSLAGKRTEGENDGTRRIKTEMLVQMQGVGQDQNGVLVLGATNLPSQLDSAVLRRFEQRIYISLPDTEARKRLFKLEIGSQNSVLGEKELDKLAQMTDGYSGSDISQVCKKANMTPIRRIMNATHFKRVNGSHLPANENEQGAFRSKWTELDTKSIIDPPLSLDMFVDAICKTKKTVSPRDLMQYKDWAGESSANDNASVKPNTDR